jgi:hypothetical protein
VPHGLFPRLDTAWPNKDLATFSNFTRQVKCPSSAVLDRAVALLFQGISGGVLCAGLIGSLAFLPIAMAQGAATRRRVPILPPANGPHHGRVAGVGTPIRLLAIGESSVSGIGVRRSEETVAAVTARALGRLTNRPVVWRALGFSGATAREATAQLVLALCLSRLMSLPWRLASTMQPPTVRQ